MRSASESSTIATAPTPGRAIIAATVGNMLEWYDFTIYAAFAVQISRSFFPTSDETVSLMLSFVTFGLGFLARPIGAIFLGAYADRNGRSGALSLTIFLMAIGTAIIALCPTYASIGIAAPIIVLIGRLVQGFSAGGEIGGAVSTLVEYAPAERRGFFASFQQLSQGGSTMLSGLVSFCIALSLSAAQIDSWGWRVAFLVGLLIAPVGIYIRRSLKESQVFETAKAQAKDHSPIKDVIVDHWRGLLAGMFVVMMWTVAQYITNYMPTFASRELHMSLSNAYFGPIVTGIVLFFSPLVGLLADRFRRKWVMASGAIAAICLAYPLFSNLVANPTLATLIMTQIGVGFCMLIYTAPASAVLAELFPTHMRATGVSLCYSLGVALFGGFTPALITLLISWTHQPVAIAFYLMTTAVISLFVILTIKDHTGEALE